LIDVRTHLERSFRLKATFFILHEKQDKTVFASAFAAARARGERSPKSTTQKHGENDAPLSPLPNYKRVASEKQVFFLEQTILSFAAVPSTR
jgi:hypothetical protein